MEGEEHVYEVFVDHILGVVVIDVTLSCRVRSKFLKMSLIMFLGLL